MSTNNYPPVLCYVDDHWAYFTTRELSEQCGDDWNDAPYEHNAGEPYQPHWSNPDEKWEITKVAFDGPFIRPKDGYSNSPWTVDQINAGETPWVKNDPYWGGDYVVIFAGVTLDEFCALIRKGGGNVYLPIP